MDGIKKSIDQSFPTAEETSEDNRNEDITLDDNMSVEASTLKLASSDTNESLADAEKFVMNQMINEGKQLISRNVLIERTVQVHNFARGLDKVKRFYHNPFATKPFELSKAMNPTPLSKLAGYVENNLEKYELSTDAPTLLIADAGVLNNVAVEVVLRPQRTTDLMIVMDFSSWESDDQFDYKPLLIAASQAWVGGLEFPNIDLKEITNLPPKELFILPSSGPNCPTVLWFTLCNKRFRNIKNYSPKSTEAPPPGQKRKKFNDFTVFGKDTTYDTFSFQYEKYHFDQLKELMYHNVSTHIEDIKSALAQTIQRKRKNINS